MGIPFQIVFMAAGRNSPGRMQIKLSWNDAQLQERISKIEQVLTNL